LIAHREREPMNPVGFEPMKNHTILVIQWLPDGELARWTKDFPDCDFVDGRDAQAHAEHLPRATITYGLPTIERVRETINLRWIQLASAGVPLTLCPPARERKIQVTNLAGLYGPSIAEHAFAFILTLSRNLHVAHKNQLERKWDRDVIPTMRDIHGKTLAVVGLGNIGQNIARLAKAFGMRVVGCRRTLRPTPFTDRVYGPGEVCVMLADADYVVVAAPFTRETDGMLGPAEFQAMKPGAFFINVSRGGIAQEPALLEALRSGRLAGAGLDVFAVEPLAADHPLWTMPNVLVSPHYSGERVNFSSLPAQRFTRNLHAWLAGRPLEGIVNLELGY